MVREACLSGHRAYDSAMVLKVLEVFRSLVGQPTQDRQISCQAVLAELLQQLHRSAVYIARESFGMFQIDLVENFPIVDVKLMSGGMPVS